MLNLFQKEINKWYRNKYMAEFIVNLGGVKLGFPMIIGHRGAPVMAPENTMASFKAAIKLGVDGIETDVQETADGHLVLCHDELLNRTTNGKGLIKDYRLSELKELSAGAWFGSKFENERIPTLKEFFDLVCDRELLINIEIKSGVILYPDIEKHLINMIHEYNIGHKVIISSFNHYSLLACKKIDSGIKTGILYMAGLVDPWLYAKHIGADALHPLFYNIRPEIMEGVKKNNITVNPFTVDNENEMRYMISMGVDGIITNYPDRLLKIKNELGGSI